jgi:hypothetical protein
VEVIVNVYGVFGLNPLKKNPFDDVVFITFKTPELVELLVSVS